MKKYQYTILTLPYLDTDIVHKIDNLGLDGWEMVNFVLANGRYKFVFKREQPSG
jgi:hypothetical protein